MLRAAYRSIVRILPVAVKASIKRVALSMVGTSPVAVAGSPSVQPQSEEPVTAPIDPVTAPIDPVPPPVDPIVQYRMEFAESYFRNTRSEIAKWAHHSRENDNFT